MDNLHNCCGKNSCSPEFGSVTTRADSPSRSPCSKGWRDLSPLGPWIQSPWANNLAGCLSPWYRYLHPMNQSGTKGIQKIGGLPGFCLLSEEQEFGPQCSQTSQSERIQAPGCHVDVSDGGWMQEYLLPSQPTQSSQGPQWSSHLLQIADYFPNVANHELRHGKP